MTAQPDAPSPDTGSYEVIRLGRQAAVMVPVADFLRLRALEQAATPRELEDAEDTAAVLEWKARDAAGQTTFASADEARCRLSMPPVSLRVNYDESAALRGRHPRREHRSARHHPVRSQPGRADLRRQPRLAGHRRQRQSVQVHRHHPQHDGGRQQRADPLDEAELRVHMARQQATGGAIPRNTPNGRSGRQRRSRQSLSHQQRDLRLAVRRRQAARDAVSSRGGHARRDWRIPAALTTGFRASTVTLPAAVEQ